jgi:Uma2 family endonuclease
MTSITLKLNSIIHLTDEQFSELCLNNPHLKLEKTEKGDLIIMLSVRETPGDRDFETAP